MQTFTVGNVQKRLRIERKTVSNGLNTRTMPFMYADTPENAEPFNSEELALLFDMATPQLLDLFGSIQLFPDES